jgi:hypothetical protein
MLFAITICRRRVSVIRIRFSSVVIKWGNKELVLIPKVQKKIKKEKKK